MSRTSQLFLSVLATALAVTAIAGALLYSQSIGTAVAGEVSGSGTHWVTEMEKGIVGPACSSSSPTVTCSGGSSIVTLAWTYGGQHGGCSWSSLSGVATGNFACNDSWTSGSLANNTSYSYAVTFRGATPCNPSPDDDCTNLPTITVDTISGSFTTANCALPTATLTADPTNIPFGGQSILTWSSTNADDCGSGGTSGSTTVSPIIDAIYTLTCSGPGGLASDTAEVTVAASQCSDGVDNDDDDLSDAADPGCWTDPNNSTTYDPTDNNEADATTQCQDGVDNDDDDLSDAADPGCYTSGSYDPSDNDETDTLPVCSNNFDDDGDGLTDFPDDPGCSSATDTDETAPDIVSGLPSHNLGPLLEGSTITLKGTIYNIESGDAIGTFNNRFRIDIGNNGIYDFNLDALSSITDLLAGSNPKTVISPSWNNIPVGTHAIQLCGDTPSGSIFETKENNNCGSRATITVGKPQCSDGVDNDNDGVFDTNDPGCYTSGSYDPSDNDETDTLPVCSNNFDDDGDNLTDFPDDLGCSSPTDNDETAPLAVMSIDATPTTVEGGGTTQIVWSTSNTQSGSCSVTGTNGDSWTGNLGNQQTSPVTEQTVFTLTCLDIEGNSVSVSITVSVLPIFEEF